MTQPDADRVSAEHLTALVPHLRRYARALTRDPWLADDLVQDTLERAWSMQDRFTKGTRLRAWAFAIMHNLFMSQIRRNDPLRGASDALALDDLRAQVDADPVQMLEVSHLFDCLPEDQRTVLFLIGIEEFSYAETALALRIPIGTVMSRLYRARERIKEWLDTDEASHPRADTGPAVAQSTHLRIVK